jgi:hypothetical protein
MLYIYVGVDIFFLKTPKVNRKINITNLSSCRAKSGASGFPYRDEIGKCYPVGE